MSNTAPVQVSKLERPIADDYRAWGCKPTYYKWEVVATEGRQLWKRKSDAESFAKRVRSIGYKAALNS